MPDAPHLHRALPVGTAQGVSPRALLGTLTVGFRCDDRDRALDDALPRGQGVMHPPLDLGKRLGGLHPIISDALQAFGKHMLHHTADEGIDVDRFPCHPFSLMRAIMIGDAMAIIAVDAPPRNRRTHDLCGEIGR